MAEGKDYEAVLTTEAEEDTVRFEGTGESKQETIRRSHEDIELSQIQQETGDDNAYDEEIGDFKSLLEIVEKERYEMVKERVTATALLNSVRENPLLLAIKVIEKLRERAGRKGPDEDDLIGLANRVEEFTLRFLDPLKYEDLRNRRMFVVNPEVNAILETAINLEQKKFFDHPIIDDLMSEWWYSPRGRRWKLDRPWLWLFLNVWCLFDVIFFPLSFVAVLVLGSHQEENASDKKVSAPHEDYKEYFTIPYFIFIRDTLSYLALLALHFAICIEPSQLSFSGLEWAILVFIFGRLLVEIKQIADLARTADRKTKKRALWNYLRDRWNIFDLLIIFVFFFAIFPLRVAAWVGSESASNNRILKAAGYLYGLNTMLLTVRAFGSMLEVFEGVGTIQIAFFYIIRDAAVVVVHFIVITVAFSSAITKVFVSDTSTAETGTRDYSWLSIIFQLGLSLLDLSDGLEFFKSADSFSEGLVHLLFAIYLIMALILLINMLIALLSNTYQRVQDNSQREWTFQKAVTIQTYRNYHPIPVPFNIVSILLMLFPCLRTKKVERSVDEKAAWKELLGRFVKNLQIEYRLKYGDSFPPTDPVDQMLADTNDTESMVNQVLHRTFITHNGIGKAVLPTGPEAWETHRKIHVEGCLLTCLSYQPVTSDYGYLFAFGARYDTNFSPRFPHFEVMALESADKMRLFVGVVRKHYDQEMAPGFGESVGFHTDLKIFDFEKQTYVGGKQATGVARVRRGDVIRCTLMFGHEQERDGSTQIPVVFTVNGTIMVPEGGQTFVKYSPNKKWYPYVGFNYKNSVLAKMCLREDVDYLNEQLQTELAEVKSKVAQAKCELSEVKYELRKVTKTLGEKLDAVLAKVGDKQHK